MLSDELQQKVALAAEILWPFLLYVFVSLVEPIFGKIIALIRIGRQFE